MHTFIRPPRDLYDLKDLGPARRPYGKGFLVQDAFELESPNKEHPKIVGTIYSEEKADQEDKENETDHPLIIYLHGNCSSQLEVRTILVPLLAAGFRVAAFDFTGSGHSGGEYVSLGIHESRDLKAVTTYLRQVKGFSRIGLWGRSMGAATAIMYASEDPAIVALCCDSSFSDLRVLSQDVIDSGEVNIPIPKFLVGIGLNIIRQSIFTQANFDIYECAPINHCATGFAPAIFAAGNEDLFINKTHSKTLFKAYQGEKKLVYFKGDHNSIRPNSFTLKAVEFLRLAFDGNMESLRELDFGEGLRPSTSTGNAASDPSVTSQLD